GASHPAFLGAYLHPRSPVRSRLLQALRLPAVPTPGGDRRRSETFWFGSDERSGARPAAGVIGLSLLLWGDAARRPEAPRWHIADILYTPGKCPHLRAKRTLTNCCLPISIYEYTLVS